MGRRVRWTMLCTATLLLFLAAQAVGDGIILPDDPARGQLVIVSHDVEVSAHDGLVTTHVDQVFRNPHPFSIEGIYVFPVPAGATVSGFTLWVDGEALEARLLDADEARDIYQDYVRRAIDPALLEYVGRDTLSARIFPIPAGGERRIEITYSELLAAENDVYRYRYPLDTERFSLRPLERVRVDVELATSQPLAAVYSPTHELEITRGEAEQASAVYEEYNVRPAQDFVLYYAVTSSALGTSLLTYGAPGEDPFFLLVVSPPDDGAAATIAKDIVVVLDRSGSMSGEKIEQAKAALQYVVTNLNPEDRFAVLAFSDGLDAPHTQLAPVTATAVAETLAWLSDLGAWGGTNLDLALTSALALLEDNERPRFLVFLTDGEPTVGEVDPVRIAADTLAANASGARLFAFGVGYNVNATLLDQLALENHGTTSYVAPGEDLSLVLSAFYRKIASPLLSDTALRIDGVETYDVFPRVLPDVFRGTQLLVLGRAKGFGAAEVSVSGQTALGPRTYTSSVSWVASLTEPALPRLWAGRKIAYYLDQIRLYGESDELVNEIIALSRRYGIITPYTSFLVEEEDLSAEAARDLVYRAAAPSSGAGAVQGAASLRSLAEDAAAPSTAETVRAVGDRVYFLRDGVWTDSLYAGEETLEVAVYSAAYFALIDVVPWIGPHLAVGDRLIVRVDEVYVRIAAEGAEALTESMIALLTQ